MCEQGEVLGITCTHARALFFFSVLHIAASLESLDMPSVLRFVMRAAADCVCVCRVWVDDDDG